MKFEPRRPDTGVNVSTTHPLAEAGTLLAGLTMLCGIVLAVAYFLVDALIVLVPAEKEAEWFRGFEIVESRAPASTSEIAASALLADLATQWSDAPYAFRLQVMENDEPNALALPGGLIVVTTGLLETVPNENALAFVLAHELGHFRNRDHIRQLGRATAVSLFLAGLSASDGAAVGGTLANMSLRSFGRRQESAADLYALDRVNHRYGHVAGASGFFDAILERHGPEPQVARYLSTHPLSADRVEALAAHALERGFDSDGDVQAWPPR